MVYSSSRFSNCFNQKPTAIHCTNRLWQRYPWFENAHAPPGMDSIGLLRPTGTLTLLAMPIFQLHASPDSLSHLSLVSILACWSSAISFQYLLPLSKLTEPHAFCCYYLLLSLESVLPICELWMKIFWGCEVLNIHLYGSKDKTFNRYLAFIEMDITFVQFVYIIYRSCKHWCISVRQTICVRFIL